MILLLSGASSPNFQQKDTEKSLGGYISITPVPNIKVNSLFSNISQINLRDGSEEFIGIFIKNNSTKKITDLKITNIYSRFFEQKNNQADFSFAFVEVVNEAIEIIPNKNSQPFYAEFQTCESKRAYGIVKILTAPQVGEVITILGVSTDPIPLQSQESAVDSVVLAFSGNSTYTVKKKNSQEIFFEVKEHGVNVTPITYSTTGISTAQTTGFTGGSIDEISIIDELLPNELIGMWIKRKVSSLEENPVNKTSCDKLFENFNNQIVPQTIENTEIIFDFNEVEITTTPNEENCED